MSENKHPKGLPFLFFAEMWERFGYYLMIGIFVLFLQDDVKNGGYGMSLTESFDIYGTFIALVFLTPFLGGLLADRKFGYRTSITVGGLMMGAGYCLLSVHNITVFYFALSLIIFGNGFFKPNISTLLGNLYNEDRYRPKKDAGFNIFYMGINIGAFVCNFFGAALYNVLGWGAAFIAAGIGMFIGIIIFWIGTKHYKHADVLKPVKPEDASLSKIFGLTILPALVAGIIGWMIPGDIFGSDSTDAFIFGCIPVIWFYYSLYAKASADEKRPIAAMLAIFTVVIAFWAVFKQNGTALTKWADSYTDRTIPESIVGPVNKLQLLTEVTYVKDTFPKTDEHFRKIKDAEGKPIKEYAYNPYFKNASPEQTPAEGTKIQLVNTSIFQSVNPGWVILLTPVVVMFFSFLRRRGREPSTPSKIAWGLVISALSTFVMVAAVYSGNNGLEKNSAWFLIASYGVITVGELFLSPMGLSLVSKMSPPRLTALMMGGWFLSTSIGNKLSGILATMWDTYDNKANYFLFNFGLLIAAAAIIFIMLKWLNRIFKEYNAG
ncbi:MAG TPA: peptide MFS transporter [Bacteroidia bacterium]|jgi:POT family proton-dependent oligopeptide transporter